MLLMCWLSTLMSMNLPLLQLVRSSEISGHKDQASHCCAAALCPSCTRQNQGWRHHIALYKEAWDFVHVRAQETTPASGRDLTDYILTDWLADWIQHAASAFKLCREFTNADSYVFSEAGRLPTCFTIKNVIYSDGTVIAFWGQYIVILNSINCY